MSTPIPRSQIRLSAVTGSLVAISEIANSAIADGQRLANLPAEQVNVNTLEGILGQMGAALKRIQGDSTKDFTAVSAGVFKHEEAVFSGSVAITGDLQVQGNDIKSSTGVVALQLTGSSLTVLGNEDLKGDLVVSGAAKFNSTLETDGKATLASAMVENLNVAGGIVFTDAQGNLDNDAAVAWDGSSFEVIGNISGSGDFLVGGNITAVNETLKGDLTVLGSTFLGDSAADNLFVTASAFFAQPIVVNGNQISGSAGGNITLQGGGDVVVSGDLTVGGNDIKASDGSATITLDGRNVTVAGDLQVTGNEIKSSTGSTVITLSDNDASFADDVNVVGDAVVTGSLSSLGTISGSSDILVGGSSIVAGNATVSGTMQVVGNLTGSTAEFSGQIHAASAKLDSLTQPGVVIAGADGLLTTTASLFYTANRLEVSSSVRISGDMAVNGEGGVADITSTATAAAIFDVGVDTIYMGADAELIMIGEQGGLVDFAGDVQLTGSMLIAGTSNEMIDKVGGGSLTLRAGDLTGSVGKVTINMSGSKLSFGDGLMESGGWSVSKLSLADTSDDWLRFKSIFGETSILSAIATAAALPTDAKFMYKVQTVTASLSGDIVRQVGGSHFSSSYSAVPTGSRNENVDVFLNGQLLVSKSYDAVNYDYDVKPDGTWINFNFDLQPDDFVSILVPQTVASVADWVSGNGFGGGSGGSGGGSGATDLNGLTDVAITSPVLNQVLKYNGTSWVNAASPAGATDLDGLTDVSITSPSANQVLKYNGTSWVNDAAPAGATDLDGLTDVSITSPASDQVLKYNGTSWVNAAAPLTPSGSLDGLTDVVITSAATNQVLTFNGTNWVNSATQLTPSGSLDGLTDVVITSAASEQVLKFDGTNWINASVPLTPSGSLDGLTDVVITSAASEQVLKFDGTNWINATVPLTPSGSLDGLTDVVITSAATNQVLTFNGTNWVNSATQLTPSGNLDGLTDVTITSVATSDFLKFTGSQWVNTKISYDFSGAVVGRPLSNEIIMRAIASHSARISSGYAYCETAPTSQVTLTIQEGTNSGGTISYANIGTIVFSASQTVGTVTITTNPTTISAGEIIRVVAPGTQDATFASPTISIFGIEV